MSYSYFCKQDWNMFFLKITLFSSVIENETAEPSYCVVYQHGISIRNNKSVILSHDRSKIRQWMWGCFLLPVFFFTTFHSSCLTPKFIFPACTLKTHLFLWETLLLALFSFLQGSFSPPPPFDFFSLRKMAAAGRRWITVLWKLQRTLCSLWV